MKASCSLKSFQKPLLGFIALSMLATDSAASGKRLSTDSSSVRPAHAEILPRLPGDIPITIGPIDIARVDEPFLRKLQISGPSADEAVREMLRASREMQSQGVEKVLFALSGNGVAQIPDLTEPGVVAPDGEMPARVIITDGQSPRRYLWRVRTQPAIREITEVLSRLAQGNGSLGDFGGAIMELPSLTDSEGASRLVADVVSRPAVEPAQAEIRPRIASGQSIGRKAEPSAMVIVGAAGNLVAGKLVPALYNLATERQLPPNFPVIGVARREGWTDESFRAHLDREVPKLNPGDPGDTYDEKVWTGLIRGFHFVPGDLENPKTYGRIKDRLDEIAVRYGTGGNTLYYLASGPEIFSTVVGRSHEAGLLGQNNGSWRRVVIEKPFGRDMQSARELNAQLLKVLTKEQIYRIDHYLGKETVQNLIFFRLNGIFERLWNRQFVEHVQITVAESLGVEGRGGFYDKTGALRDMVSHLFQLLALTAMEPPASLNADALHGKQVEVLNAIRISPENAIRGQYEPGVVNGEPVPGYRSEPKVASDSQAETFVALKLFLDMARWWQVPFYLRTGKRMLRRCAEIVIQFKPLSRNLFRGILQEWPHDGPANQLVIHIQPDMGIELSIPAKVPGPADHASIAKMIFNYGKQFPAVLNPSTGYERLLLDCMLGNPALFTPQSMVEATWKAVQPILDWSAAPLHPYMAGTSGPKAADELIGKDGHRWRALPK